jgi:hypothetical protein
MEILSIRRGFASDHSSTSYEFLAVDKPLGKKERSEVSRLSSRASPTSRRVSFVYHVDGYDIPGGWEKLMARYYDVMYCEDYGWWTLAMAFNGSDELYEKLRSYEFDGTDDLGIGISKTEQRITITINCVINDDFDSDYDDYDDDDESGIFATDNELLNILTQIRQQIMGGDFRALYTVWEKYGDAADENPPSKPENLETDKGIVNNFKNMLDYLG